MTAHKTVLITGSTDGIGLEAAKVLASLGCRVLLHGRNRAKLEAARQELEGLAQGAPSPGSSREISSYVADLSRLAEVQALAEKVAAEHPQLDVLINNAGVYGAGDPRTEDGLDIRFAVNTFAPYLLTRRLAPNLGRSGRVINLSSAAQAPVNLEALMGDAALSDGAAYAQSKLALTMWSRSLALSLGESGPVVVAVNPGSLLGTKMVRDAYGIPGGDVGIGAEILRRAALDADFAAAGGQYFDNDSGRFASPHADALDASLGADLVRRIEAKLAELGLPVGSRGQTSAL
ncbi:MAG: SDR family NAD(P)-dependent oxidoreductase [Acidobacteriota bacterium]